MSIKNDDKFKLLIKVNNNIFVELCNVLIMRKNGEIYEYKIIFPLFGWKTIKNAHYSSIEGILNKPLKEEKFNDDDGLEICYHSRGSISYKIKDINKRGSDKHKYERTKPINKFGKYCHFLKVSIANIDLFPKFNGQIECDSCIEIPELLNKSFSIDFYFAHDLIKFKIPAVFKNSYQFCFKEKRGTRYLLLHFYEAKNINNVLIKIISDCYRDKIISMAYNYWYILKNYFKIKL